ncbi:hypothetical protein GN958_ATG17756, partial [Phytophthora infestans]
HRPNSTWKQTAKRRMTVGDFISQLKKEIILLSVLTAAHKIFERRARPISDVYRLFIELLQTYREINMPISERGIILWMIDSTSFATTPMMCRNMGGSVRGFPLFHCVVMRDFATFCYSADTERKFWMHKFVHSSTKRLKQGSVDELVLLFFNAKNLASEGIAVFVRILAH